MDFDSLFQRILVVASFESTHDPGEHFKVKIGVQVAIFVCKIDPYEHPNEGLY
jgi:hypothetical protein